MREDRPLTLNEYFRRKGYGLGNLVTKDVALELQPASPAERLADRLAASVEQAVREHIDRRLRRRG